MGLFDWLKKLFGPPARDVSLLGGDELDQVEEQIDLSGGPLKPNHHRRAIRDRRLLPKKKKVFGKRPRVMTQLEADRFFSATFRTQRRDVRDLLSDRNQIERYGLPLWESEEDIARALGIDQRRLRHFSIHKNADPVRHYVSFAIPKRSGGERVIMAPKRELKTIQRKLLRELVDRLPVSEHAHGFRKGRSIRTNAQLHRGRRVVLKLDLADFFPSVSFGRVRGYLIAMGYSYPVATTLAVLMTEADRQPVEIEPQVFHVPIASRYCVQGAPTSPGLCNAIASKMDQRLAGLAKHFGFAYSRYADDLSFSGDELEKVNALRAIASKIIREEGFEVNRKKTQIRRSGGAQRVTGVTVNETVGLSRKERRKIRAMIHQGGGSKAEIEGKIAYVHMLNPSQAEALRRAPRRS